MFVWNKILKAVGYAPRTLLNFSHRYVNYENLVNKRHYIYILKEREFIKTGENIYKIGKTTQEPLKRMAQYPKGSMVFLIVKVDDCHKAERQLLGLFNKTFEQRKDIGREYYHGNICDMIKLIMSTLF